MKKSIAVVLLMMLGSVYTWPVWADTGGALPNTPESVAKIPAAGAPQTDMTGAPKLVVKFQSSHAEIPASNADNLKAFGKYLKDNPDSTAQIAGYADHTGSGPANGALAQKRADAVKEYLVNQYGVDANRITAAGYGQVTAKSPNSTEAAKQMNRTAIGTITKIKA